MHGRIRKICIYGLLTALCMVLGWFETLLPLSFAVPGIKLGLANTVALLLIGFKDYKGALAVNSTRILLSALLFGNPMSLAFSLAGGLGSFLIMFLCWKSSKFSFTGLGILGGATHNFCQLTVAFGLIGKEIWWYVPLLLTLGGVCGGLIGSFSAIILKKMQTNWKK